MSALNAFRSRDWDQLKIWAASHSCHEVHEGVRQIAETGGLRFPLDGSISSNDDVLGLSLTGGIQRYRAWRVRGGLLAEHTEQDVFRRYRELMEQAVDVLDAALAIDPRNPLAAGFRSTIAVEEDHEGKVAALKRVQEAGAPVAAQALGDLLSAWTYKWGGSQDEMWTAFLRLYRPADLETLALVPHAHWEQQTWHRWFDKGSGASRRRAQYYGKDKVRAQLSSASDIALTSKSADTALLRYIDSWFARMFSDAGNPRRAKLHFQRLGNHIEVSAWSNGFGLISMETRFKLARLRCGLWGT